LKLTVARVIRKSVSCETLSTSGELFMIVFTLASGKLDPPGDGEDILSKLKLFKNSTFRVERQATTTLICHRVQWRKTFGGLLRRSLWLKYRRS